MAAWLAALVGFTTSADAFAQITPERLYVGVNQAVQVKIERPAGTEAAPQAPLGIALLTATGDEPIELARLELASGAQSIDLAKLFPTLWTTRQPRLLYAQLRIAGEPVGPALILQPLLTPQPAASELDARVLDAVRSGNDTMLRQLTGLSDYVREQLAQRMVAASGDAERVYSGLRCYVDKHVIFETSLGAFEVALRPDAAPNTCFNFLHLAKGGAYDGVIFHRVVAQDVEGNPFLIQTGDPTGSGSGGPGYAIDYEQSPLLHEFGVLSMAHRPDDPNSAGSQFFICLSREACAHLDGRSAAFAEVVDGVEAIDAIAAVPVAPAPGEAESGYRPINPPVIERVRVVDAPPLRKKPPRIERPEDGPVER